MNLLSLFSQTSNDMYAVDMSNIASDGVILGITIFFISIAVIAYAIISYLLSRIFKKAGIPGWKAWVPVYSTWVTLELGGQAGWLSLLLITPSVANLLSSTPGADNVTIALFVVSVIIWLVATVYLYIAMYKIGQHFGKEDYFVLWAIFLPIVWYAWLAFDQSTWKKSPITAKFDHSQDKNDDSHSAPPTM
jgi:hypothetical protein